MSRTKRGLMFVVLVVLLVIFSLNVSAEGGCYINEKADEDLYCVSGITKEAAKADCDAQEGCDLAADFKEDQLCNLFPECEIVTCNIDCQDHTAGKCVELGGQTVLDEQYEALCTPGCCVLSLPSGGQQCDFPTLELECGSLASKKGLPKPGFFNEKGMTPLTCKNLCTAEGAVESATLKGVVKSSSTELLSGANLVLVGKDKTFTSGSKGEYEFKDLTPGIYLVEVKAENHQKSSATVSLASGEVKNFNFTLVEAVVAASVSGNVSDGTKGLDKIPVFWKGPVSGNTETAANGKYLVDLPAGTYTFTVGGNGYASKSSKLSVSVGDYSLNFTLEKESETTIKGVTFVDLPVNGVQDADDNTYGVKVYIDGVFRYSSAYPSGDYVIDVAPGSHKIHATYLDDYLFGPENFNAEKGQVTPLNIFLTKKIGECTSGGATPHKAVEVFAAQHVPGEEKVKLVWQSPCPEVVNYKLIKGTKEFVLPAGELSYVDEDVKWEGVYDYSLIAVYQEEGKEIPSAAVPATITLGKEFCEGKYHETGWETFCVAGKEHEVTSCSNENQVIAAKNCGETLYCAPLTDKTATCKGIDACFVGGGLFGLSYTKEQCYGTKEGTPANFCYFDNGGKVVDECGSCTEVEDCNAYQSQDSCEVNSCLTDKCKWVDAADNDALIDYSKLFTDYKGDSKFVTPETGRGYCVEEEYNNDDLCSLCSSSSTLLENYYCTADVCTALGRCFSNPPYLGGGPLSSCNSCGDVPTKDKTCYSYSTELECSNKNSVSLDPKGNVVASEDSCGWNVCAWDGTSCYKDGDANQKDDCNGLTGIQRAECKVDITPPVTATSGNTLVISSKYQNFTFKGTDTHTGLGQTNAMGVLGYCLSEATTDSCSADKFKEINYPGNLAEESIIVNLFNDLPKDAQAVKYRLKYYSKDVYGNKGSVEQVFLHVDTVNPSFIIKDKISTSGDKADITVYLEELNEQMQCNFGLTPVVPVGAEIVKAVGLNANKEVQFSGLVGARFDLKVECEDAVGNKNSKNETYVVDLEQRIEVISPSIGDVLSETSVTFVVKTTVDATCALHRVDTNEKISNFLTDGVNLKEHKTPLIAGFTEGGYKGTHKVVCTDILIQQKMEKLLDFGIDFTAPVTNIELKEGDRIENPVGFGWEKSFVKSVEVSFNCVEEGFECEETKYCLGKSCEFKQDAGYKKFETTLTLNGSATICYYSKDKGGNEPIQPLCGEILIEGHGLTLEKPSRYYYEGEQWGISAEREFDLVFYTKVPTSTCKLGFTKGFDYTNVEPNRVLQNTNGKYSFLKFPGAALSAFPENGGVKTVFIKCEDVSGVVGPEHVVHLEYDPTIPVIEEAYANPSKVLEGTKTGLFAETDDKTQCRYSDNSEDTGSSDYGTMEFSFPDEDLRVLRKSHEDLFSFNFVGTTKNYKLNMQCKNGAEGISETEIVSFLVDYTATGNIIKASPIDGYFKPGNVSLELETSKTALCSYKLGEEYVAFANTNGKVHTSVIGASAEMTYLIPVRCQIGSHLAKGELKFTIDNTPPKITSVEEGNFTCGSDVIGVMVYSNETKTEGYAYELYDQGVALGYASYAKNNSKKVNGVLVNGTGGSELPIQLSTKDLEEGHKYKVKVWSWDAVGLTSQPVESDGIIVVPKNATECKTNKAPGIEVVIDSSSCTQAFAQIKCSGSVGCKNIKYGVDKTAIECLANKTYSGTSIAIESSAYVCYEAENYAGNILKGSKLVGFSDSDGDEVADSCDLCIGTISGESVDSVGCADGQVSEGQSKIDEDGDQLPDSWEKLNSRESCPLDYRQRDSNGNGISDGLEDYDNDGLTVYQEYVAGTDPCVADNLITPKTDDVGDILSTEDKTTSDSNILAWVLLLFGLLLIAGGVGYLIYYYKAKGEQVPVAPMIGMPRQEVPKQDSGFSLFGPGTKPKSVRRRTSLFTEFGRNSEVIPHVDKALSSGGSHQERVSKLAKNYVKNKEQIQPGLRPAEKGLFAKLEKIAGQQNSGKKINEIISSKQAKGIFGKLRELTKKRKQ